MRKMISVMCVLWAVGCWGLSASAQDSGSGTQPRTESSGQSEFGPVDTTLDLSKKAPATDNSKSDAELAKELQNPVANLISVPFQTNFEFKGGQTGNGFKYYTNIQPVVPITLNDDWNLISRTIMQVAYQTDYVSGQPDDVGLGETTQSFFFSPSNSGSVTWGVGPALLLPTATDTSFGAGKWAIGPTAVVLTQQGPWTAGILANHLWSYAGDGARQSVNATYIQPFGGYTFSNGIALQLSSEMTYDWNQKRWVIPMIGQVSKVMNFNGQRVNMGVGAKYYVEGPTGTPEWGLRFTVVLLFPK